MRKMWTGAFLLLYVLFSGKIAAQKREAESLLWRVSGNGLKQSSYLFGTIHIKDKRVFNFSDSLYYFLDKVEAFALEIHPDSITTAILNQVDNNFSHRLKDELKSEEYQKISKRLKSELGVDAEKLSVRDAYFLKRKLAMPKPQKDDMPTFVDMFLYDLASRKHKLLFGLERVEDQFELFDEVESDFDPKELLKGNRWGKSLIEEMIELYTKEQVNRIPGFYSSYMPDTVEERVMTKRNYVMLSKFDSLSKHHSLMAAVGAAHLPGKDGLIALLRQKGYEVMPIITNGRTHASKFKNKEKKAWVAVNDSTEGYFVEMPSKPTSQLVANQSMNMNMLYDLTTMQVFYVGHAVSPRNISSANRDSMINIMLDGAIRNSQAKEIERKDLVMTEGFGKEVFGSIPAEQTHLRFQVKIFGNDVYIICYGSARITDLRSDDTERFLASFRLIPKSKIITIWSSFSSEQDAFSVKYPGKPGLMKPQEGSSGYHRYNITDPSNGYFYSVVISPVKSNPFNNDDLPFLSGDAIRIVMGMDTSAGTILKDTIVQGYKAQWSSRVANGLRMQDLTVIRNERSYSFIAMSNKDKEVDDDVQLFFSSIQMLPYQKTNWRSFQSKEKDFTTWAPAEFEEQETERFPYNPKITSTSFDKNTGSSFYVHKIPLSKYQWIHSDSSFLRTVLKQESKGKKIERFQFYKNGSLLSLGAEITNSKTGTIKKMRIMRQADTVYYLEASVSREEQSSYTERFFDDFKVNNSKSFSFNGNNLDKILTDLQSKDTAISTEATKNLIRLYFDREDFHALCKAAIRNYYGDSLYTWGPNQTLFLEAEGLVDAADGDFLADLYKSLDAEQLKYGYNLLKLIIHADTLKGIERSVSLFEQRKPTGDNAYVYFSTLESHKDALLPLIPRLMQHLPDTTAGYPIMNTTNRILDSSFITKETLLPYCGKLFEAIDVFYKRTRDNADEYVPTALFELVQKLAPDSLKSVLDRFVHLRDNYSRWTVFTQMSKWQIAIPQQLIDSIAADPSCRIGLYDSLLAWKKEKLFPARHLTQEAFALSHLYNSFDEESPEKVIPIGSRIKKLDGKLRRFYLYKVYDPYREGNGDVYLGVSGAFDLDSKNREVIGYYRGIHYEESFSEKKIDKILESFIKQFKKYTEDVDE